MRSAKNYSTNDPHNEPLCFSPVFRNELVMLTRERVLLRLSPVLRFFKLLKKTPTAPLSTMYTFACFCHSEKGKWNSESECVGRVNYCNEPSQKGVRQENSVTILCQDITLRRLSPIRSIKLTVPEL